MKRENDLSSIIRPRLKGWTVLDLFVLGLGLYGFVLAFTFVLLWFAGLV